MTDRRSTYLIQDPYDDDAVQFIRTMFTYFGLRPVCLYTDPKARFYGQRSYPILRGDLVEGSYDVAPDDLRPLAAKLRERYRIAAVIPYREDTLELAADVIEIFELDWNDPATLRRFRDKGALRRHVRAVDPSVRLPQFRNVDTSQDVFAEPTPDRFVLKPNNGFGNHAIGVFDRGERDAVVAHIEGHPDDSWILGEYISGTEYNCNGQVRHDGDVMLHGIFRYQRAEVNDYSTVYDAEIQVHTDAPVFDAIVEYATRLLAATGLRGCPFHVEVKVDDRGPCLIDLGARLPSEAGGFQLSRLHPERPDVYAIAAHDYLGPNEFATTPTDWPRHDRTTSVLIYGISEEEGTIAALEGIAEVEARPDFVHWVVRPAVGDRIVPTRELRGAPYIAMFCHRGGDAETEQLLTDVRRTIRWDTHAGGAQRLQSHVLPFARRATRKTRWLAAKPFTGSR